MGVVKFLKWLTKDDSVENQQALVDATKRDLERLKNELKQYKEGISTMSGDQLRTLRKMIKERETALKNARENLKYLKSR